MSKMIVRPPQFWANPFGNPAEDYNVYVGVPNYDPRQEQYQLAITDGVDGPIVSNPFKVNKGLAKNANGELITPVINQQEYSLFFESPSGGGIEIAKFIGDGLSSNGGGSGGGIPDLTINNLDQALQTDLSAYNFVFIKSESSGWEGSANGPSIVSFYYRDGTTGAASSGDENKFFDLSGNGWSLAKTVGEKNIENSIEVLESYRPAVTFISTTDDGVIFTYSGNAKAIELSMNLLYTASGTDSNRNVTMSVGGVGGDIGGYSGNYFYGGTDNALISTPLMSTIYDQSNSGGVTLIPNVNLSSGRLPFSSLVRLNKLDGVDIRLSLNVTGNFSLEGSVCITAIPEF